MDEELNSDALFDNAESAWQSQGETQPNAEGDGESGKPQGEPEEPAAKAEGDGDESSKADADQQPGTAKPEGEANPQGEEEQKGALPESLKPFETVLKARGWEGKTPDALLPEVLKSYTEMESRDGMRGREIGLLNQREIELRQAATGNLDALNQYRKTQGLPELHGAEPASKQLESKKELVNNWKKALQGDEQATQWLNDHFMEELSDVQYRARREQEQSGQKIDPDRQRVDFQRNMNAIQSKYPDSNVVQVMDTIYRDPELGPLLDSHNLTPLSLFSTPERAEAWYKLASKVKAAGELEAKEAAFHERVEAEVKKRLNHKATNRNRSTSGQFAPSQNSDTGSADADKRNAEEFMEFAGGPSFLS